ncbi:MAG: hypothetical protein ABI548_29145 [Polyangiaceae bacterium]
MRRLATPSALSALALAALHCSSGEFTADSAVSAGGTTAASGAANAGTSTGGSSSGAAARGGSPGGGALGTAGAAEDGGNGGEGGQGVTPCDATKRPSEAACVVNDDYAIFVAPMGKDTAVGTMTAPVKTFAKAVMLAGTTKIVIACDGTYDEQVMLTSTAKLYGGFSCPKSATPWTYETGKKATVAPSARGLALSVASGASRVVIEDFEFDAQAGVDPGESSVAAFVNTSSNVTLTRVKLVAGKGVDGANGSPSTVTFPMQSTLIGHDAAGDSGGPFNLVMCPAGGSTKGGVGGNGGAAAAGGGLGAPDLGMGKGGTQGACLGTGSGQDGANATGQTPAPGATKLGTINPTGWSGVPGTDGTPGTPGQGGGGGTGAATGGGGGGGGAGGCGGAGGTGGKAGGSSIALLVLNSTLTMTADELVSSNAGKGGNGIAGQNGQKSVGSGGNKSSFGCGGGAGGQGGTGGAGGGAAGGVSVGIAYVGATTPTPDSATTITTGTAGAKGIGGVAGTNDGIAGVKQDVLLVP